MTASLRKMSSKADSNTWESFTRSGLKLEIIASPRSDIFRKRATKPLLKQKHRQKHLTWAKEKKNRCSVDRWLLLCGPKSSFQMKVHFAFHLEIKVPESGGRLERYRIHVAWSPMWRFHSQWWFGMPWHHLILVHFVLSSPKSMQRSTRRFLEHSMLPSADKLYVDADFLFLQDFSTTVPEPRPSGLLTIILLCLINQPTCLT